MTQPSKELTAQSERVTNIPSYIDNSVENIPAPTLRRLSVNVEDLKLIDSQAREQSRPLQAFLFFLPVFFACVLTGCTLSADNHVAIMICAGIGFVSLVATIWFGFRAWRTYDKPTPKLTELLQHIDHFRNPS